MTGSERERHDLAAKLEELLGPDEAATLMEHLPPVRWDELARQEDLLALRVDVQGLKTELTGVQTEVSGLKTELTGVHTEVSGLKTELTGVKTELTGVHTEVSGLKGEMLDLRSQVGRTNERIDHLAEVMELRFDALGDRITAHVAERVDNQTKLLVFSLVGAVLTAAAIALGSNAL
jgi:predicted  nucleic acid-binding Zn-ribbon protein